jgi:hypothetical protein
MRPIRIGPSGGFEVRFSYIEFGGTERQGISLMRGFPHCPKWFLQGKRPPRRDRAQAWPARTQFGNRSENIFRVEAPTDVPMGVVLKPSNFFDRTNRSVTARNRLRGSGGSVMTAAVLIGIRAILTESSALVRQVTQSHRMPWATRRPWQNRDKTHHIESTWEGFERKADSPSC